MRRSGRCRDRKSRSPGTPGWDWGFGVGAGVKDRVKVGVRIVKALALLPLVVVIRHQQAHLVSIARRSVSTGSLVGAQQAGLKEVKVV